MTYRIGNSQAAKQKGYYPLVGSDTMYLYRYHNERRRCITKTYGATTIHYSYSGLH
jgi:hypothetical protein